MSLPVISVARMREWEEDTWAAGRKEARVIGRVGKVVARRAGQLTRPGSRILILAGKGHNGDDARAAKDLLAGRRVQLLNVTDPTNGVREINPLIEQRPALIVDGLFGIGINRTLNEKWVELIQRINDAGAQVLAVDVPSGLNADTGEPEGGAIRASFTLTLGAPKLGLLLPPAWPYVGRLEVAPDIGLTKCPHTGELNWALPADFDDFPPARPAASHKGSFGHLAIVAGSMGFHGAAVLTSRGAQRAQPGLITLFTTDAVYHSVAPQLQAVMVSPYHQSVDLPEDAGAYLIGPGLAAENLPEAIKATTRQTWRSALTPVVIDASALDWLPAAPIAHRDAIRVVTPHPGEAARLLRVSAGEVQADRPRALRGISRQLGGCWVVLKGQNTLIGRETGPLCVNSSGNPQLAQGGSGDVLAGYLAGLLAQPQLQANPFKTICYGVWRHGAAADRLSLDRANWVVEDLTEEIGNHPGGTGESPVEDWSEQS